jgi:sugar/nucleoside kinase (ribokinase family)
MLSDRGAAARLAPADLPELRADHVHLSGYVLADPGSRPAGLAALAAARAAGASTSLDPQATGTLSPALLRSLGRIDLLLPAAAELAALSTFEGTGTPPPGGVADPRAAEAWLDVADAVVVTHGAADAVWVDRTGRWAATPPSVGVVDPTGAGDAFDAGLVAAWLAGASPREALAAGCVAGAEAVSRRGARPARRRP